MSCAHKWLIGEQLGSRLALGICQIKHNIKQLLQPEEFVCIKEIGAVVVFVVHRGRMC